MQRSSLRRRGPEKRTATSSPAQTLLAAELHIRCREHNTSSLAAALGVSTATTARIVAELRRRMRGRGAKLVAVWRGGRWHYETCDDAACERRLDRLGHLVGLAPGRPRAAGESIDDVVYGRTRR
jgi:hypothetical protein